MKNKLTKQILIGVTEDNNCAISVSPDMDASTAIQLIGTLSLHILNAYKDIVVKDADKYPASTKKAVIQGTTESLYDAMNNTMSNVLSKFYPEHVKYSLEDEAIIELVNKKIEDKYNSMSKKDKAAYAQAYNRFKLKAEFRKDHMKDGTTNSETSSRA